MNETITLKDYLRGSKLTLDSTWYRIKNNKRIPLKIAGKWGLGSGSEHRIVAYEFEHMRTGKLFELPWLRAVEMLEEGTLIPNYDFIND